MCEASVFCVKGERQELVLADVRTDPHPKRIVPLEHADAAIAARASLAARVTADAGFDQFGREGREATRVGPYPHSRTSLEARTCPP